METYKIIFNDDTEGVFGISLVESPAMESSFIALSEQKEIQLKAIDNEKRILLGAVLIPEKPIYRNQNGKEFNIIFPAETVRLSMENFFKKGYQNSSTLEHDEKLQLSDVTFVESWIKESELDKSVHYGMNEPVGTWFASMKVNNDEIWNDFVKTGKVKGFSIDGFFDLERINLKTENMNLESIVSAIKDGFASLSKTEDIKVELGSVMTQDQSLTIEFEGDTLAVGTQLNIKNEAGDVMPLPDGEYILENGMVLTVADGLVSELSEAKAEEAEAEMEAPAELEKATPSGVKSEKHTQEIFYQLAKEFGTQLEALKAELKADFTAKLEEQKEVVSLTKNKPAVEKSFEEMTALEKFRLTKNK
jgi:hypothetical protein